jgi:NAD(P)-dependent dehydrogenase (short-subunit alcohol dehydrogenase family)
MRTYAMTGGASGIGAAIKNRLRNRGDQLIVVDIRDADIEADLGTAAGRTRAIDAIRNAAPEGLDGFIACAGLGSHVPNARLVTEVNYFGSVELVEGLKDSLAARRGSVILVSSNSAPMASRPDYVEALLDKVDALPSILEDIDGQAIYAGSKQALTRWMRRNCAAYAANGIRMNALAPGYTETPMTAAVKDDPTYGEAIRQFVASIPLGRPGEPEDMADAVEFLLGDGASFVCGSVLFVDGGHDAMLRPDQF